MGKSYLFLETHGVQASCSGSLICPQAMAVVGQKLRKGGTGGALAVNPLKSYFLGGHFPRPQVTRLCRTAKGPCLHWPYLPGAGEEERRKIFKEKTKREIINVSDEEGRAGRRRTACNRVVTEGL